MARDRRRFLRSLGALGTVATGGLAGCAALSGGDRDPDVVLGPPDIGDLTMEQYRGHRYPVWGEPIPDVSLPAALSGETVDLRRVSTPSLVTFVYTHCEDVCPRIVSALVNVQGHAVENGYADGVAFLPITVDPNRDDADRLRAYREEMGVRSAGRWQFLRPPTVDRAKAVATGEFGITVQQREGEDGEPYTYIHTGRIFLVNADGYVERVYAVGGHDPPPVQRMIADLRKVRRA